GGPRPAAQGGARRVCPDDFPFPRGFRKGQGGHPRPAQAHPGAYGDGQRAHQGVPVQLPILPAFAMRRKRMPGAPEEYLKRNLERAGKALRKVAREERDISAVTVSLSAEAAQMVRWEFRDLMTRVLEMAKSDQPEKVYQ